MSETLQNKKVSVIVPVHNSEKYISQCIDSILNQTYRNIQLILIDDNSTDRCPGILEEYKRADDRILLKHVCAGSAGKARNYGLKEADGYYLAFVDSDDWIEPCFLEELIAELEKHNCDCAMCGVALRYTNGNSGKRTLSEQTLEFCGKDMRNGTLIPIAPGAKWSPTFYLWDKVYKRSLWENIPFDEDLRNAEDRVALYSVFDDRVRTVVTPKLLYNYRMGVGITSQKQNPVKNDDYVAGYKILKIAKEKNQDLSPVYQTIVCHTLGKARNLIKGRLRREYSSLVGEFREIYPLLKREVRVADKKYKFTARMLRYFPNCLYLGFVISEKLKAAFRKKA